MLLVSTTAPPGFRLPEILELTRDDRNAFVKNIERNGLRLR